ncbi:MAG: hypothetical protein HFG96_03760 [Lachnospiraceae bacterium]|mgnify:CR=1 FL=1|jgi:hypothetical protein|nr:hypothetical protein [Lachnospiraceae bacterium]RKJ51789.1 hypothetical protein D7Y05_01645 [bacterium 1XD42-54]
MRKKKLLTAALCTVLLLASCAVSGDDNTIWQIEIAGGIVFASEDGAPSLPVTETPETKAPETQPPQTQAPETEPPLPPETETQSPETQPPQTETQDTGTQNTETQDTETQNTETQGSTEPVTGPSEPDTEPVTTPETELPSETQPPTETNSTETMPTESESESESETEKPKKSKTKKKKSKYKSNKELIANQKIVIPPDIELEFRFAKVDKRFAIVKNDTGAKVYEEKSGESTVVGELDYYGLCYILEDQGDGWYYIESGNVRGFLKAEEVVIDEVAERIAGIKGVDLLPVARLLVARTENSAFEYTHTTVQDVVVDKVYALASGEVKMYEQRKSSSTVTGILSDQALCYILADSDKDWVFVESGDARGFVEKHSLITGNKARAKVSERGEKNMTLAQMLVEPKDNKACYYTLTSVKEASQAAKTREAMVKFALQFVGNRYVWGGTSLTDGADCSGFVQSIYANFDYSIPRVAEDQAGYGLQIPIDSAEPGDLIFYARNGYVYHVSMYIGDGQVVQAANSRAGIITSGIADDAVWATRVITD